MSKSTININSFTGGLARPSLTRQPLPEKTQNILDSVCEPRYSDSKRSLKNRWVWLPVISMVAFLGWITSLQEWSQGKEKLTAPSTTSAPVETRPPVANEPATVLLAVSEQAETTVETSSVVTAYKPDVTAPSDTPSAATAPPASTNASLAPPQQKAPTQATKKSHKTRPNPSPNHKQVKAKPSLSARVAKKTTVKQKALASARDPDVELITAIMKHLGEPDGGPNRTGRSTQAVAGLGKTCLPPDPINSLLCQRGTCNGSQGQVCPPNLGSKPAEKTQAPKDPT